MKPEAATQKAILDYLTTVLRIPAFRRNTGAMTATYKGKKRFMRFAQAGQSDLWGWLPFVGTHWELEIKGPGNRPTADQMEWLVMVQKHGGLAEWTNSVESASRIFKTWFESRGLEWRREWDVR